MSNKFHLQKKIHYAHRTQISFKTSDTDLPYLKLSLKYAYTRQILVETNIFIGKKMQHPLKRKILQKMLFLYNVPQI